MAIDDYWPHQQARPYSPLEVEYLYLEMMDHATAAGHILKPVEQHPTLPLVHIYRCSGCVVSYRLCVPGPSAGVWDSPCLGKPYGVCPSSFEGVVALASGEEGGLTYWAEVAGAADGERVVGYVCEDEGHGPIRYLQGRVLGDGAALFPLYCTPHMWQCVTCGRLVAKLSNPMGEKSQLHLSHISCGGPKATLRGARK